MVSIMDALWTFLIWFCKDPIRPFIVIIALAVWLGWIALPRKGRG